MTRALATIAAAAALAAAMGCALVTDINLPGGVVYPSISPDATVSGSRSVSHPFRFEGREIELTVIVDEALYAGATQATKSVIRFGGARADDWIEDYYPAFIWEEQQEQFFTDALRALRDVRDAGRLDPDRYAELITVYVQSLEYRTDPVDLEPKFPVETLTERAGDCDDKTLLLAGLLAREGYDVALMLFDAEQHVALGLRTSGPDYRGTGYAFVETTGPGLIGMVPETLAGGLTISSAPQVFPVDGGELVYGAGDEVATILDALDAAAARIEALARDIVRTDGDLETLRSRVDAESRRLDELRSQGRTAEYNSAVSGYNALVVEFNALAEARNSIADEYNRWVDHQHFIAENLDDRPALYRRVTLDSP